MPLFYKPADSWAADFIPFYWQGDYHLFYLKDYRDRAGYGEGTPWYHLATRDFITFTDHGEALPRGAQDSQDLYVFTGCVIEKDGQFHIYYTGHNPHLRAAGRPEQAIMHATSQDLIHWTKDPANPILFADRERYEPHDWRDPFVFWNDEAAEYWMLLAARLKHGPSNRRGCIAVAVSRDLASWEIRDPLWAPGLYFTHECPDLFRIGEWWYLLYSTFSERMITHYRMSRSLAGPWTAPVNDSLDGRAFYAAKTASDGQRRFAFGWNPSRTDEQDTGKWQWGGHLVVHELNQEPDGALSVRPPDEVRKRFTRPVPITPRAEMGHWEFEPDKTKTDAADSFAWLRLGSMPAACYIETNVTFSADSRGVGIILRADDTLDAYYQVRLEPGRARVVFDRWPRPGDEPFVLERPLPAFDGEPVRLQVLVEETVIEIYVNGRVALSARGYNNHGGSCGLFVTEGTATFERTVILDVPGA